MKNILLALALIVVFIAGGLTVSQYLRPAEALNLATATVNDYLSFAVVDPNDDDDKDPYGGGDDDDPYGGGDDDDPNPYGGPPPSSTAIEPSPNTTIQP